MEINGAGSLAHGGLIHMETEATYEIDTVDADASTALATPRPEEIDVEILRSYLTSWKQGGQQVTQFTARGVQHLAQMLNLSIV